MLHPSLFSGLNSPPSICSSALFLQIRRVQKEIKIDIQKMLSLQLVNNLYLAVGVKAAVRKTFFSGSRGAETANGGQGIGVASEGVNEDFLR